MFTVSMYFICIIATCYPFLLQQELEAGLQALERRIDTEFEMAD